MTVGRSGVNGIVTDPVTLAYHELRSPLALMATMARSAAEDCSDEELRSRCLSMVQTAERMLRTASHVMLMADAAKSDEPCRFAPAEVVRKVVSDYRGMRVAVTLDVSPTVASDVFGAPGQLEALLCSVMGNALDHGNPNVPLRISVSEGSNSVRIQVRNAMGRSRTHKGLGLGSYIGDRLARALNASLELSRSDEEFVARIALPVYTRQLAFAV